MPGVISRLGDIRRFQQQSKHLFGCSLIFPSPPDIFAFPEILAFFILESTNNTKPRAILSEYTREIQPQSSHDDILTVPGIVFSGLVDILVTAYP